MTQLTHGKVERVRCVGSSPPEVSLNQAAPDALSLAVVLCAVFGASLISAANVIMNRCAGLRLWLVTKLEKSACWNELQPVLLQDS